MTLFLTILAWLAFAAMVTVVVAAFFTPSKHWGEAMTTTRKIETMKEEKRARLSDIVGLCFCAGSGFCIVAILAAVAAGCWWVVLAG